MVKVYGIRHHGPGSSRSLVKALENFQPDCILVEAPADASHAIPYVGHPELLPPAAILIYDPKNLSQASYLPFATFSPEWQAILFANTNGIPIKLMDLPMSINFALDQLADTELQIQFESKSPRTQREQKMQYDPLGYLGELAGYQDSERWWEISFEHREGQEEVFPLILEVMRPMREATKDMMGSREVLREAFMRKTIRQALKEGYQKTAVVCGAWHAPVLEDWASYRANADNKLLRGLKKVKTVSTWIPWSYRRLALQSGYGAGVISPAWYELLFHQRQDVVIRWMTGVARLLRKEDLDASSAHAIAAVRLADGLASLRDLSIPGIEELKEAAVSIFCEGDPAKMELIEDHLVIGDVMGQVPAEIPVVPLQKDLEACIKTARLSKERKSTQRIEKKLDLRKVTNLKASHLLHRLKILGIHWGETLEGSKFETGGFSEYWALLWQADFAFKVIEAGMWGNTVYDATVNFAQKKAAESDSLPEITHLIGQALKADLVDAIDVLVQKFQQLSAMTKDVHILMEALSPLVHAIRYGSTRKLDVLALEQVVDQIIPRIGIGLPGAVRQINQESSEQLFDKLLACNHAIGILNQPHHTQLWNRSLKTIALLPDASPLITGACNRILFDKELIDVQSAATQMQYALSGGQDPLYSAHWLEGFLFGSGLLLIHNQKLWSILDNWVEEMDMESLKSLLPLLRRSFAHFSSPERQKMLELVKGKSSRKQDPINPQGIDKHRAKRVVPMLRLLLGLK